MPSEIHDREIARLAALFSPDTLETVALQHFDASEAKVKTFKADRREDTEGFKRDLLTEYRNKGHGRKVKRYKACNFSALLACGLDSSVRG